MLTVPALLFCCAYASGVLGTVAPKGWKPVEAAPVSETGLPEIFTGYHWGTQAGKAFPAQLSSLSYARSSWSVSTAGAQPGRAGGVARGG